MKFAVAVSMAMLVTAATAAEKKTSNYTCKGGNLTITATIVRSSGVDQWSKTEVVL